MKRAALMGVVSLLSFPALAQIEGDFVGPYIGVEIGYSDSDEKTGGTAGLENWSVNSSPSGEQLGLLVGVNSRLNSKILLGIEVNYSNYLSAGDTQTFLDLGVQDPDYQLETELDSSISLSARTGYLFSDNLMGYAGFGYSSINVDRQIYDNTSVPSETEASSGRHSGWLAEVGVEYIVQNDWHLRAAYKYADYSPVTTNVALWDESYEHELKVQALTIAAVYHF